MRKKVIVIVSAALVVALAVVLGYRWKQAHTVNPEAVKVINVMMTCPNDKYYSPKAATVLGEGTPDLTEEQKKEQEEQEKKISANWKTAVGSCFEDDFRFEQFLSGTVALKYQAMGKPVSVKKITLTSKDQSNGIDKVKVTASVDGQKTTVPMEFMYGKDGKLTTVRYL